MKYSVLPKADPEVFEILQGESTREMEGLERALIERISVVKRNWTAIYIMNTVPTTIRDMVAFLWSRQNFNRFSILKSHCPRTLMFATTTNSDSAPFPLRDSVT